ncbi:IucA/IucC family C-terminal-domain containing protein [Nonomuraea purpurea]|uniref:IucA/IucC family C-terminal-domain containing protein n=1 Tax=Nonomuraea purpurea TaxID=1849276 RepID=A0ABV8GMQ3_9ACTN
MILDHSWDRLRAWQYAERYLGASTRSYSPFSEHLDISEAYHPQRGEPASAVPTFVIPAHRGEFLRNGTETTLDRLYRGDDHFLLPVHPDALCCADLFQRERLLACERGPDLLAVPSANARTMFVERVGDERVEPHFVKLHYPRRLSRFTRRLRRPVIELQLWAAEQLIAGRVPVLPEVAGGVVGDDPYHSWGFLIRETRTPAADGLPYTVPLFALYGGDVRRPGDPTLMEQLVPRPGEAAAWLAEHVVAPMVSLWVRTVLRTGLALEPHGQNALFAFDPDDGRTAVAYRDCAIYVDPQIRVDLGLDGPLPPVNVISRDIMVPRDQVFSLTYDSFLAHHVLERLARVAERTLGVQPPELRRAAREAFTAVGGADVPLPRTVYYYDDRLHPPGRWRLVDTGAPPAWR